MVVPPLAADHGQPAPRPLLHSALIIASVETPVYDFPHTVFEAHAPGFSVVRDVYVLAGKFYFGTYKPWSCPEMRMVIPSGALNVCPACSSSLIRD